MNIKDITYVEHYKLDEFEVLPEDQYDPEAEEALQAKMDQELRDRYEAMFGSMNSIQATIDKSKEA